MLCWCVFPLAPALRSTDSAVPPLQTPPQGAFLALFVGFTMHATTRDGTAKAGSDYLARSAELTFKPHQRRKRFAVSVIGDNNRERNETFTVRLSAAKGARLADTQATATITNDD